MLLRELERDGRASFARLAALLGVSDQTAARRYRRLCEHGGLRIAAQRGLEYPGQQTWLLRLRVAPGHVQAVAGALAGRRDTSWVALASGGTEVSCAMRFATLAEQEELLLTTLPRTPGIASVQALQILGMHYGGPTVWLDKRLDDGARRGRGPAPREHASGKAAGPEDEPLISALERDARTPLAELAKAAGRSESSVRRRLDQLLARGEVHFNLQFSPRVLGDTLHALLWITSSPRHLERAGRRIAEHPRVSFVAVTTGATNLAVMVTCANAAGLHHYLAGDLAEVDGLHQVEATPVLRHAKQLIRLPGGN
jgi:DNA-binding Lrp family transcriptional regulator